MVARYVECYNLREIAKLDLNNMDAWTVNCFNIIADEFAKIKLQKQKMRQLQNGFRGRKRG